MTAHYSKFNLNTYLGTPYFQAQLPESYPVSLVLQKSRAYRRLPPNLRKLAVESKRWAERNGAKPDGINEWYDALGNELDPDTGHVFTDDEINAQWDALNLDTDDQPISDIPLPRGGFPDPNTWSPPPIEVTPDEDGPPSDEQLRQDIASHGYEAVSKTYGIPIKKLPKGVERLKMVDADGEEILGIATGELYKGG